MSNHERALECITTNDLIGLKNCVGAIDVNANGGDLLWAAANLGHLQLVEFLLPLSDPQYFEDALMAALAMGRDECIGVLLQHVEEQPNSALWVACDLGNIEMVHMLLPHCDMSSICVLELAVRTFNQELFDQVFALSDTDEWKRRVEGKKEQRDTLHANFQSMSENYVLREHITQATQQTVNSKRKM